MQCLLGTHTLLREKETSLRKRGKEIVENVGKGESNGLNDG
jgi:hypothetical protein